MRLVRFSLVLSVWLAGLLCASAQTNPTDLPPSPFALPASTEPQSASYSRDAARALELHAASANAAVQKALGEIRDAKERLTILETNAWQKDPLLLACDGYIGKAHDWVMARHRTELGAAMFYFHSTNDQATVESRRKLESALSHLTDVILFKELGDNTNFTPLVKSLYGILEQAHQLNTNSTSRLDVYSYWRFDPAIGFQDTNPPTADYSFTNLHAQISKRYDLLVAKLGQIQQEQNVPPEVMAGLKYGDLYRTLDGMCEVYLEVRTPPELQKLREDLRRKIIDLSWLEK